MQHLFRALFFLVFNCIGLCTVLAQDSSAIVFRYQQERTGPEEVLLSIKANLKGGARLYAIRQSSTDVPASSIVFDSASQPYLQGQVVEPQTFLSELDENFNTRVNYFSDSILWLQKVRLRAQDSVVLKGTISYMYKDHDAYLPGESTFKFFINPLKDADIVDEKNGNVSDQSLLWIFMAAFAGGLLALLTPCVYSMIPVTVSFFTKRSKTKVEGIRNALYYAASIVLIFTLLGFLVTLVFGPAALNNLATNWIANLVFFVLFLLFGFSFLGAFEITLPSSWMNKSDSKAGSGSFFGIFFMALTLVLVSFSCTGPIIGNLLVLASKGSYFGPLVGMAGFSTALALPFALFAFFPSKLNVLGKAGGWLNSVKVTLGFLELALALKFLSNADLVKGWRILDREVFITLWIVLFLLLGVYLLGKLTFSHDDELPKNDFGLPYIGVPRLLFAISALAVAVYLVPGLWGAPLKSFSAFVPPMGTQDFVLGDGSSPLASAHPSADEQFHPAKYYAQMKMYEPEVVKKFGLLTYFDYDEALAVAKKVKKPLMLDFTGINCVNCRKMEGQVWSDPAIMKILKEDFIVVSLYVDVQNVDLPEMEHYYSKALLKQVETLGDKNADFQVSQFGANAQPYYFFLDANEKRIVTEGYGYDPDIEKFKMLLQTVKEKYALNNNL